MLPKNMLGDSVVATLRGLGVDVGAIRRRAEGRLGVYYVETGANQRGSTVTYDRDHSAISLAGPDEYDFAAALDGIQWVHATGITPSLSEKAHLATLALVQEAKRRGCTVSCDLNYRKKLWRWRPGTAPNLLARECMSEVLKSVDLLIANEEDAADVLDIHATGTDVESGKLNIAGYEQVAREIVKRFPNISPRRGDAARIALGRLQPLGRHAVRRRRQPHALRAAQRRRAITSRTRFATSSTASAAATRSRPA